MLIHLCIAKIATLLRPWIILILRIQPYKHNLPGLMGLLKVDVPQIKVSNNQDTCVTSGIVHRCASKNVHLKIHIFKRDWNVCSKCANHFKFGSQHDWVDLCEQGNIQLFCNE
jgi:hypothetical protein